jgi:hypothetical protein
VTEVYGRVFRVLLLDFSSRWRILDGRTATALACGGDISLAADESWASSTARGVLAYAAQWDRIGDEQPSHLRARTRHSFDPVESLLDVREAIPDGAGALSVVRGGLDLFTLRGAVDRWGKV